LLQINWDNVTAFKFIFEIRNVLCSLMKCKKPVNVIRCRCSCPMLHRQRDDGANLINELPSLHWWIADDASWW
jgi:hypothetical protein